jgi:hypothetical protein
VFLRLATFCSVLGSGVVKAEPTVRPAAHDRAVVIVLG